MLVRRMWQRTLHADAAPHPNPLPAKAGRGESVHRFSTYALLADSCVYCWNPNAIAQRHGVCHHYDVALRHSSSRGRGSQVGESVQVRSAARSSLLGTPSWGPL
jgi:hypothetical protein